MRWHVRSSCTAEREEGGGAPSTQPILPAAEFWAALDRLAALLWLQTWAQGGCAWLWTVATPPAARWTGSGAPSWPARWTRQAWCCCTHGLLCWRRRLLPPAAAAVADARSSGSLAPTSLPSCLCKPWHHAAVRIASSWCLHTHMVGVWSASPLPPHSQSASAHPSPSAGAAVHRAAALHPERDDPIRPLPGHLQHAPRGALWGALLPHACAHTCWSRYQLLPFQSRAEQRFGNSNCQL